MSRSRLWAAGLLILAVLSLSWLWWKLDAMVERQLSGALQGLGIEVVALEGLSIGLQNSSLGRLELSWPDSGQRLDVQQVELHHAAGDLFQRRITNLHAASVVLKLPAGESAIPDPQQLMDLDLAQLLQWLPTRSLAVSNFSLVDASDSQRSFNIESWSDTVPGAELLITETTTGAVLRARFQADGSADLSVLGTDEQSIGSLQLSAYDGQQRSASYNGDLAALLRWVGIDAPISSCQATANLRLSRNPLDPAAISLHLSSCSLDALSVENLNFRASLLREASGNAVSSITPAALTVGHIRLGDTEIDRAAWHSPLRLDLAPADTIVTLMQGAGGFDALSQPDLEVGNTTFFNSVPLRLMPNSELKLSVHTTSVNYGKLAVRPDAIDLALETSPVGDMIVTARSDRVEFSQDDLSATLNDAVSTLTFHETEMAGNLKGRISNQLPMQVTINTTSNQGEFELNTDTIDLGQTAPASVIFPAWPETMDLLTGLIQLKAGGHWNSDGLVMELEYSINNAGGFIEDAFFSGLNSVGNINLAPEIKAPEPLFFKIDNLDYGIGLDQVEGQVQLRSSDDAISIEAGPVNGRLYDGHASIDAFRLLSGRPLPDQTVMLNLDRISLRKLAGDNLFSGLDMDGRVSGNVPVILQADGPRIDTGRLFNEGSGYLSYDAGQDSGDLGGAEILFRALKRFQFATLEASPVYHSDGTLLLKLRLEGYSDEIGANQPIHFNINLEQNLLKLFESIRLVNGLNDDIDERVKKFYQRRQSSH